MLAHFVHPEVGLVRWVRLLKVKTLQDTINRVNKNRYDI